MNSIATFETEIACRYLATLCKHFGTKVEVDCTKDKGWVKFPFGRCDMTADDTKLELRASAEDRARLDEVVQVVTNHLERFAFRENPTLEWHMRSK